MHEASGGRVLRSAVVAAMLAVGVALSVACNESGSSSAPASPLPAAQPSSGEVVEARIATSSDDLADLARLLGDLLGPQASVESSVSAPLQAALTEGPPSLFNPFDGAELPPGPNSPVIGGLAIGGIGPGWMPPPCGPNAAGFDVLCPPEGQHVPGGQGGYLAFGVNTPRAQPEALGQVVLAWSSEMPPVAPPPETGVTGRWRIRQGVASGETKKSQAPSEPAGAFASLPTGSMTVVRGDQAWMIIPRSEAPSTVTIRITLHLSAGDSFTPTDTVSVSVPDATADPLSLDDVLGARLQTLWGVAPAAPQPTPTPIATPPGFPRGADPASWGPIEATFDPSAQTTSYSIGVPEGRAFYVRWSGPDCGTWTPQGWSLVSGTAVEMSWHHPHPPCDPTLDHRHVQVKALLYTLWSDADGSRWLHADCTYQGAASGLGPACDPGGADGSGAGSSSSQAQTPETQRRAGDFGRGPGYLR